MIFHYGGYVIIRDYKTIVRRCNCTAQDCRGVFLIKEGSDQTVCYNELVRIYYQTHVKPVMAIIEERIWQ